MFRLVRAFVLVLLLAGSAAPAGAADAARLVASRSGQTPRGATRVVFETDRPVEYLSVERPSGDGFEIHLLDVDGTVLPTPPAPKGQLIGNVVFRGSVNGIVASLTGTTGPLRARTFTLLSPPRVVVDLYPESTPGTRPAASSAPPRVADAVAATKPKGGAKSATKSAATKTDDAADDGTIFEMTSADEVATQRRTVPKEQDFEDLLVWIHGLQNAVEALNGSDSEGDRARYRRRLGYLLVQRGILGEGEKALLAAMQGSGADSATAVSDSVTVAEVRVQMGEFESASEIARAIDTKRARPSERVRLAEVLLDTGQPTLALELLGRTVGSLTGSLHADGTFLLARAYHSTGKNAQARDTVRQLTSNAATPPSLLPSALLLHADCEFALGRAREAEALYARAAATNLPAEDASWAALQLGNLARRDGRYDEAQEHWRLSAEKWPDTFFASQAAWFLRVSEQLRRVQDTEVVGDRG